MRFRKLSGVIAGALVGGALAAPAMVAPAQAAGSTIESFVSTNCKYGSYASDYRSDFDVAVDGTAVTVTFDKPFNPGFGATPTFSYLEPKLALNIDGQTVNVSARNTFDPARAGNSDMEMPVLTGTLSEAVAGNSVSITSMKLGVQLNIQAGPNMIHPEADMTCTLDTVSTLDMACTYQSFKMFYAVKAYTNTTNSAGTALRTYLDNAFVPGMPAFLSISSQTPTLKTTVNDEAVTFTGTATYDPAKPGNTSMPMPKLTATRTGTTALANVAATDFDTSLLIGGDTYSISCDPYVPTTTTTTNSGATELTCVYSAFLMPYSPTLSTTYDRTDVAATLSDVTFGAMPASFKIHSVNATLSGKAGTTPITLTSDTADFSADPLAGNAAIHLPGLEGTTPSVLFPTATTIDLITFNLMIVTGFGPNPTVPAAATIKCGVAAATTTTLAATSSTHNTVSLTATISNPAAAGKVAFYEGATKLGSDVTVASGAATATVSDVPAGAHTYTAKFTPTEQYSFKASTSAEANVSVAAAATTTTVTATSPATNQVSLAATVAPGGAAGTVEFYEGSTKVGQTAAASGSASLSLSGVAAGQHSYTAKFVPTDTTLFAGSTSAASTVTVADPAPAGPTQACVTAQSAEKSAQASVKTATTKAKAAKTKVTKLTAKVKKLAKVKTAKGKKQLKSAKAQLKTAKKASTAATKALTTATKALTTATAAVKAQC